MDLFDKFDSKYTALVLRIGLALLFLYFGFSQISDPVSWSGFVPTFVSDVLPFPVENFVLANGALELLLVLLLIVGFQTRIVALLAAGHMAGIVFGLGFSAIAVRDFMTMVSCIALFFAAKVNPLSLDEKVQKSS